MEAGRFSRRFLYFFAETPPPGTLVTLRPIRTGFDKKNREVLVVAVGIEGAPEWIPMDHLLIRRTTLIQLMPLRLVDQSPSDLSKLSEKIPARAEASAEERIEGFWNANRPAGEEGHKLWDLWLCGGKPVMRTLDFFRAVHDLMPPRYMPHCRRGEWILKTQALAPELRLELAALCFIIAVTLDEKSNE